MLFLEDIGTGSMARHHPQVGDLSRKAEEGPMGGSANESMQGIAEVASSQSLWGVNTASFVPK